MDRIAESGGPSNDPEYLAGWGKEIKSRIEEHERGEADDIPWEEARKNMFGAGAALD